MRKWGIVLALVLCLLASGALAEGTLTLPAGLKVIKAQAFAGSPATEVVLPEGVQAIGSRAFEGSAVTRITLPASITQIDEDAFARTSKDLIATVASGSYAHIRCQEIGIRVHLIGEAMSDYLYEMRTDGDGKRYAVITGYDGPTNAGLNIPAEIAEEAFCGREELTGSLTISGGVRSIGNVAFADCSGLTGELTIPSSVTSIGEGAFFGCSGLTGTLTISEGVTEIGGLAFAFCSSVETVVLPRTLTRIGDSAFDSIVNLVARVWKGSYAQQYCEGNGITVELINEVMSDYLYETRIDGTPYAVITGYEGAADAGLNIPAEIDGLPVWEIADEAFYGRMDLTGSLTIPDSVRSIGSIAFADCSGLTGELTIPSSVMSIGEGAFFGCSGLTGTLTISEGVTEIDELAFASCSSIETVVLPQSLTRIGNSAFDAIVNLVARVWKGSYAQQYCEGNGITVKLINGPMSAYLYETRTGSDGTPYAVITGYEGAADAGLNIPAEIDGLPVREIADEAFYGRKELTGSLTIPGSVKRIGSIAFADCSGLTGELTIPSSVTSIGERAFYGCSGLTGTLTISEGVTVIGESAFASCSSVETVVLPRTLTRIGGSAFDAIVNLVARVWKGSYAQRYCEDNGITVELINEVMSDYLYKTKIDDDGTPYAAITGYEGPTDAGLNIPAEIDGLPVRAIEDAAFAGRGDLTGALTIPVGMKRIGESAFMGCSGLTGDLTIPEGMETIGALAFVDCSGLTGTLTIPASATGIDDFAFVGCRFSEVIDPTGNCPRTSEEGYYWRPLGKDANRHGVILQYAGPAVSDLTIPAQIDDVPLRVIESNAFRGQRGLTGTLTIPESVTRIGNQAFFGCTGIERIVLPESLGSIGVGAFDGMSSNLVAVVKEGGRMHEYCVANGIRVEFAPEL